MRRALALLATLAMAVLAGPARADDNRPLTIRLVEAPDGQLTLGWKLPPNLDAALMPSIAAPNGCRATGAPRRWSDPLGHWREVRLRCAGRLAGAMLHIDFPGAAPALATIARLRLAGADAETTVLLQPGETTLRIPAPAASRGVFVDFLELGVEHIWRGIDHLLFVAGLIFIAGTPRRVLATITGFTIAHSITLALAALDLVRLPPSAVEGVIALSIVFLAVEIVKGPRGTLSWRHPVAVAASFGLLHGFGFAAVLREIGLPEQGLLTALLAFNLGIEIGQILFALLVMAALAAAHRLVPAGGHGLQVQRAAGYGVGILASYWMFARLIG